ncbi:MAG: SPFH domain-containing protein [Oscillospiraceae bacterium]|nr:SPFH domain-containing protein [Oscillospiraceae bacterium]
MGLIETTISAASSSSRRSIYSCENIPDNVLLAVGRRPAEPYSGKLFERGDKLRVGEGQCALLVSQGRVTDFCAVPGTYFYDGRDASPRLGPLEPQAMETWKGLARPSGGREGQQLYYVNLRSVPGPSFEAENPFLLRLPVEGPLGNTEIHADVNLVCAGSFTYRVCDPILFYTNVTGNVEDSFASTELNESLRREIVLQLRVTLARLAEEGRTFPHRGAFRQAVAAGLRKELDAFWPGLRGITLDTVTVGSVYARGEEGELFGRWLADGGNEAEKPVEEGKWFCPDCGAASTGNYCPQCGKKKPEPR